MKVYGSPMFDLVVARHGLAAHLTGPSQGAAARLTAVMQRLRAAFPPPPSEDTPSQPPPLQALAQQQDDLEVEEEGEPAE